ncbi:hypothetical protein OJ253_3305 [Cryptosporidium canis]|uniref:Uncharacterized protein n=1 Tax=Cryptosporidium canis TaxID=195482 RepID=A0A9D5DG78_9CRYT|nr:hypothetical protein OJ253_3305 [Cryptosporidium canis]
MRRHEYGFFGSRRQLIYLITLFSLGNYSLIRKAAQTTLKDSVNSHVSSRSCVLQFILFEVYFSVFLFTSSGRVRDAQDSDHEFDRALRSNIEFVRSSIEGQGDQGQNPMEEFLFNHLSGLSHIIVGNSSYHRFLWNNLDLLVGFVVLISNSSSLKLSKETVPVWGLAGDEAEQTIGHPWAAGWLGHGFPGGLLLHAAGSRGPELPICEPIPPETVARFSDVRPGSGPHPGVQGRGQQLGRLQLHRGAGFGLLEVLVGHPCGAGQVWEQQLLCSGIFQCHHSDETAFRAGKDPTGGSCPERIRLRRPEGQGQEFAGEHGERCDLQPPDFGEPLELQPDGSHDHEQLDLELHPRHELLSVSPVQVLYRQLVTGQRDVLPAGDLHVQDKMGGGFSGRQHARGGPGHGPGLVCHQHDQPGEGKALSDTGDPGCHLLLLYAFAGAGRLSLRLGRPGQGEGAASDKVSEDLPECLDGAGDEREPERGGVPGTEGLFGERPGSVCVHPAQGQQLQAAEGGDVQHAALSDGRQSEIVLYYCLLRDLYSDRRSGLGVDEMVSFETIWGVISGMQRLSVSDEVVGISYGSLMSLLISQLNHAEVPIMARLARIIHDAEELDPASHKARLLRVRVNTIVGEFYSPLVNGTPLQLEIVNNIVHGLFEDQSEIKHAAKLALCTLFRALPSSWCVVYIRLFRIWIGRAVGLGGLPGREGQEEEAALRRRLAFETSAVPPQETERFFRAGILGTISAILSHPFDEADPGVHPGVLQDPPGRLELHPQVQVQ